MVQADHLFTGALKGVNGVAVSRHLGFKSLMLLDLTLLKPSTLCLASIISPVFNIMLWYKDQCRPAAVAA